MWTFLVRLKCILFLSSTFSVMTQLSHDLSPRINQTHLIPSYLMNRVLGLKVQGSSFTLEGFPFLIIAGTIHYFRVPREYWRDRLLKLKAGGFNTLTTHIPWSLHEPKIGQYFFSGNLDVVYVFTLQSESVAERQDLAIGTRAFITMAGELGLWVILCPGPYIGSDLDLGGLPSWLLKDPDMKLRTTYKGFIKAMNLYFDHLISRVIPLQYHNGGPIIAMQIENEYGSYSLDKKYLPYVKKALEKRKVKVLLMTADSGLMLRKGHIKNVLITVHMKNIRKETYTELSSIQGRSPILMTLYTVNSFDSWGVAHHFVDGNILLKDVREMFKLGFSLNFCMFHGGTNFGFMGGAQYLNVYSPVVTSYDYGALLTEDGDYTPEYITFQEFLKSVIVAPMPLQPDEIPKNAYKSVTLIYVITLWDVLPYLDMPIKSVKPLSMEQLSVNEGSGQSYGYTLYETTVFKGGILSSRGHVQDRGQVFLDRNYMGILDRSRDQLTIHKHGYQDYHILRILIENQGRLSSGKDMSKERKGLTGNIYLDNTPLKGFTIYSLDMKREFMQRKLPNIWKLITEDVKGPAFYLGYLTVIGNPKDTFIHLEGWKKGVVFINGQNLGRYWSVGPQETLYLPGPWLQPGKNEIILFEELESGIDVQFRTKSHLGY